MSLQTFSALLQLCYILPYVMKQTDCKNKWMGSKQRNYGHNSNSHNGHYDDNDKIIMS